MLFQHCCSDMFMGLATIDTVIAIIDLNFGAILMTKGISSNGCQVVSGYDYPINQFVNMTFPNLIRYGGSIYMYIYFIGTMHHSERLRDIRLLSFKTITNFHRLLLV